MEMYPPSMHKSWSSIRRIPGIPHPRYTTPSLIAGMPEACDSVIDMPGTHIPYESVTDFITSRTAGTALPYAHGVDRQHPIVGKVIPSHAKVLPFHGKIVPFHEKVTPFREKVIPETEKLYLFM